MTKSIFIAAVLLRLFCAAFLFHPDIKTQAFHAQFLNRGEVNIYEFLETHRTQLPLTDRFNYPPLAYYFLGSWFTLAKTLGGSGLAAWVNDWSNSQHEHVNLPAFLLFLKLPYFVADLLVIALVLRIVPLSRRRLVAWLWAFNPLLLYGIYAVGQFDILPALCTLAALILFTRHRPLLAGVLLAVAINMKTYPLLLLPLFFFLPSSFKQKIHFFLPVCLLTALIQIPFLNNSGYRLSMLNSGLGTRIFELKIGSLPLIVPALGLISLFTFWAGRIKSTATLWLSHTALLALIISLVRFHGQWGVWLVPFLLPYLAKSKLVLIVFTLWTLIFFTYIFTLPDPFVLLGLFTPLSALLSRTPSLISHLPFITPYILPLRLAFIGVSLLLSLVIYFVRPRSYSLPVRFSLPLSLLLCLSLIAFALFSTAFLVTRVNVVSQFATDRFVPITPEHPVQQSFHLDQSGLSEIVVFLRNPQLKNTDPLSLQILGPTSQPLREVVINGRNVGDGQDIPFKFTPLPDPGTYTLQINVPRLVAQPERLEAGFSNTDTYPGGTSPEPGDLNFQVFYTPQHRLALLSQTITLFLPRLFSPLFLFALVLWIGWGRVYRYIID